MTELIELSSSPSIAESSDDPVLSLNGESLRQHLADTLRDVESDGSFAIFESLQNSPNPGLYLKNVGGIGLPLSDFDAAGIVAVSHRAPFGKGVETIVDENVRKTWEVLPADFEIRNPAWNSFIETIVAKVTAGLGVTGTVAAQLYKMLLYEEGAMFKPHQDSEKAPRMFATLVVSLPSKHEGGEVRVTHAGKTHLFETSKYSDFDCSFLAWFADVTHEVRPVRTGRRLVLTYNLVHTSVKGLVANSAGSSAKLESAFSFWKKNVETKALPTTLAYLFEHQYTEASLCYDGLKGHDHQVVAHLRDVCAQHGFCFYLGHLERSVEGGCDDDGYGYGVKYHDHIEEYDKRTTLKRVVDLNGTEVAMDLKFDEDVFIQRDPFEEVEPDDEDYSGFTGNEGVTSTHFYHRTVGIIMPRTHRIDFLIGPSKNEDYFSGRSESDKQKITIWIDRLVEDISRNPEDNLAREDLEHICKMVIRQTKAWKASPPPARSWQAKPAPFSDEVLMRIITITVDLDNRSMFENAYRLCAGKSSLPMFRSIGQALLRYELDSFLPEMASRFASLTSFSYRFNIGEELRAGLSSEAKLRSCDPSRFLQWIEADTNRAVSSMAMKSADDGIILAHFSKGMASQEIFNSILPIVKQYSIYTAMATAFSTTFYDAGAEGKIPKNLAEAIFGDVVTDMALEFNIKSITHSTAPNKRTTTAIGSSPFRRPIEPRNPSPDIQNSQNIVSLLFHCQTLEMYPEIQLIIQRMTYETVKAEIALFEIIYLPFLKAFIETFQGKKFSVVGSPFPRMVQMLLGTYIVRWVGLKPQPPQDWARSPTNCSCDDCTWLSCFLSSPTQRVGRFAVGNKRRVHLHGQLGGGDYSHKTERVGNPQTLVVTKSNTKHQAAKKAWKERCEVAKKHLHDFRTDILKDFLAEVHEPVMALSVEKLLPIVKTLRNSEPLSELACNGNASNRVLPPITKRKVPSEVIVLDD